MGQWAMASPSNAGRLPIACSLLLSGAACRSWLWRPTWLDRHFGNDPGKDTDSWCWPSGKLPQPLLTHPDFRLSNPLSNIDLRRALLVVASKHMYFCWVTCCWWCCFWFVVCNENLMSHSPGDVPPQLRQMYLHTGRSPGLLQLPASLIGHNPKVGGRLLPFFLALVNSEPMQVSPSRENWHWEPMA